MPLNQKIKIFISYSWDSPEHQRWVIALADLINERGGEAIVDRKKLRYGGHIKTFMIKSIAEANIVLIILTPNYKKKADAFEGGAGYEYNIINDDLFKIITNNDKYIPIIRTGDLETSATNFLRGFNCLDLRDSPDYKENLEDLFNQIFSPTNPTSTKTYPKPEIMEHTYGDLSLVTSEINSRSFSYFKQLFVTENKAETRKNLQTVAQEWEKEVSNYHDSFKKQFSPSKMLKYEGYMEDFKNKVFAKDLWTVGAALKTPDPDLARYKMDYRDADAEEIYTTVNDILSAAQNYADEITPVINYTTLEDVPALQMDFLDEDGMFMNKVIGFGIRSEILHRFYPAFFPIMTQPNLWAMYFINESGNEFITIENKVRMRKMRVSHNWQYPYDRFTFLMNTIFNGLAKWFEEYNIELKSEYRFGYVNKFLSRVTELHKADIKLLHEWVDTE